MHPFSTNADHAPELIVFDNKEGNPPHATDIWHSDETFREIPPMATALCSKVIPEIGGDTCFCSMTAAYDGLSDRMQHFLSGLEAVHDFKPFKALFAQDEEGWKRLQYFENLYRPATHPVVRVHPVTGRKAIFVNPQFTLYHQGHGRAGEPDAAADAVRSGASAGASISPPLVAQPAGVLGQSVGAACGGARLLSAAAPHGPGDDRRRRTSGGDAPPPGAGEIRKFKHPPATDFAQDRARRQFEKTEQT